MKAIIVAATALTVAASPAYAEPIGRWYSSVIKDLTAYGIRNDSMQRNFLYIFCMNDGAIIRLSIEGRPLLPMSTAILEVGAKEYSINVDPYGGLQTKSHVDYDNFRALWKDLRSQKELRVRTATGQSTVFSLNGAAKVLPTRSCKTGFEL